MAPWLLTAIESSWRFSISSTAASRLGLTRMRPASRVTAHAARSAMAGFRVRRAIARVSGWCASRAVTANSSAVLSTRAAKVRGFATGCLAAGDFTAAFALTAGWAFVAALAGAILAGAILAGAFPIGDVFDPAVAFFSGADGIGATGATRRLNSDVLIVPAIGTGRDMPDGAPAPHAVRLTASASRHASAAWRLRIIGIGKSAP